MADRPYLTNNHELWIVIGELATLRMARQGTPGHARARQGTAAHDQRFLDLALASALDDILGPLPDISVWQTFGHSGTLLEQARTASNVLRKEDANVIRWIADGRPVQSQHEGRVILT